MVTESVWIARLASEKARARRLVAAGQAAITRKIHETYIGRRGIVNYEAWEVLPLLPPQPGGAA
jgi:hypothetical protein